MIRSERIETFFDGEWHIHYYPQTDEFHFEAKDSRHDGPIFYADTLLNILNELRNNA